jgi:hypothetical protein
VTRAVAAALTRATCAGLGELRSSLQGPQAPAFLLAFLERSPDGAELQALWAAQAAVRAASLPAACLAVVKCVCLPCSYMRIKGLALVRGLPRGLPGC